MFSPNGSPVVCEIMHDACLTLNLLASHFSWACCVRAHSCLSATIVVHATGVLPFPVTSVPARFESQDPYVSTSSHPLPTLSSPGPQKLAAPSLWVVLHPTPKHPGLPKT